jgi:hypothetical protein
MIYLGQVSGDGKLNAECQMQVRDGLRQYIGKPVQIELTEFEDTRTVRQNKFLWGVCYTCALQGFKDAGELDLTKNVVHEFFKNKFIEPKKVFIKLTMEIVEERTTTKLSKKAFSEYVEKIAMWCLENLNTIIPDSSDYLNEK